MHWFDGHLDLTYLALHGRDLSQSPDTCGGTLLPASVTFPALRNANVTHAVSTIFVRKQTDTVRGPFCFTTPDEAHAAARFQLDLHRAWQNARLINLSQSGADALVGSSPSARDAPVGNSPATTNAPAPLTVHLALEGAPCLRSPEDLTFFHNAGLRILSLAWAEGSPYAGGDQSPPESDQLTPAGLDLIPLLDQLHIIHDVSHLSDRAFWQLLDHTAAPIIASHSNCRALLPNAKSPQRHLSDAQIKALAARHVSGRGGKSTESPPGTTTRPALIGITCFAPFILPPDQLTSRRATLADLLRHIDHIEQLTGTRDLLALGSDFDSGFSTDLLPADLQGPPDLPRLAEALAAANWSDQQIQNFAFNNWQNLLSPPA